MSAIEFTLKPSRILFSLLLFLHLGAIMIIVWIVNSYLLMTILIAMVVISLLQLLRRYVFLKTKTAIIYGQKKTQEDWSLQDNQKTEYTGRLSQSCICNRHFVLLNFIIPQKRFKQPLIIWYDAVDTDTFRRLRYHLKFTV